MSTHLCSKIVAWLLLNLCIVSAQVSSNTPKHWASRTAIGLDDPWLVHHQNFRDTLRREILDTNLVWLIAQSVGLTEHERTLFVVAPGGFGPDLWVHQLSNEWTEGCRRFEDRLQAYVSARIDGHSKGCLLAGLTNNPAAAAISDQDLVILSTHYPLLPVSWFHKVESGATKLPPQTNYIQFPDFCRWSSYTLIDEDIGWQYVLHFTVGGALDRIDTSKCDAKEIDPKFQSVMKEVDAEVTAAMKRQGTFGKFGAVHTYWQLKKEKLKARGIEWRSPAELNRRSRYD